MNPSETLTSCLSGAMKFSWQLESYKMEKASSSTSYETAEKHNTLRETGTIIFVVTMLLVECEAESAPSLAHRGTKETEAATFIPRFTVKLLCTPAHLSHCIQLS